MEITEEQLQAFLSSDAAKAILEQHVQASVEETEKKYKAELATKQAKLEELKKSAMSEKERADFELTQREGAIQEREAELQRVSLQSFAQKHVMQCNLSQDALPFVMGSSEGEILSKITALKSFISKQTQQKKSQTSQISNFYGKNPFSKEHLNLTEQGKLYRENPTLARQMAAQYGYEI